ncbi:hypothetical protein [Clostridium botulinum]|nr:hypothetical protein [Clostridium botulinum]EES48239.1 hypothetical protein CLO_1882 [Clostridium botulinum E1 str. 'BoNT E Beluga']MBY6761833.1 hypothetical protein [Clostridium botulinum]MBY6920759.1 hypothetical protein [Clostridium botulinum]MBY6932229.1 hypothetical protein [Clostridium botulinum]MCR1131493.1 hypothetical protein [Clostridium botulinum]
MAVSKKPQKSKNMQDAIDCLGELIRNPKTTTDRKKKAKKKMKELKKYF